VGIEDNRHGSLVACIGAAEVEQRNWSSGTYPALHGPGKLQLLPVSDLAQGLQGEIPGETEERKAQSASVVCE
jgi:hypothetical protein